MPKKSTAVRTLCIPLIALVIGAAGCATSTQHSSSPPSGSHQAAKNVSNVDLVAAAYGKTTAAKTAKVSLTGQVAGQQISGIGVTSFTKRLSELTVHSGEGDIRTIQVGDVVYTQLPAAARARLKGAKPWVKVDLGAATGNKLGSNAPQPYDLLGYVRGLSSSVTKVGTETVRGTPTMHYKATVDLAKLAAQAQTSAARTAVTTLEQQGKVKSFPLDASGLDTSGLIRRGAHDGPGADSWDRRQER